MPISLCYNCIIMKKQLTGLQLKKDIEKKVKAIFKKYEEVFIALSK